MALHTLSTYTPTAPADVTSKLWTAEFPDGVTHNGIITWPTAANALYRGIVFIRGGFTGDDNPLTDTIVTDLENAVKWNASAQGDAATGYVITAMGIRGVNASTTSGAWTGGLAIPGTDEMGGDDLDDIALTYGLVQEWGLAAGTPLVHAAKMGLWSYSAGALRGCMLLRKGRIKPAAFAMRSPLVDAYGTWDDIGTTEQNKLTALIPGWSSASATKFAKLTTSEQQALHDRSPARWAAEMPDIPYLLVAAEDDNTALPAGTRRFAEELKRAGRDVTLIEVPSANHAFSGSDHNDISLAVTRKFFGQNLA